MEVEGSKKKLSKKEAIERLEMQCSRHEMCTAQVEEKLYRWGVEEADRPAIVEHLITSRYVDNSRFALAFARDKSRFSKWGPQKIRMHLQAKRIASEDIALALEEVVADELPSAVFRELERKAQTTKARSDYELKMKLVAAGVRKGFSYDVVARAVDQIIAK